AREVVEEDRGGRRGHAGRRVVVGRLVVIGTVGGRRARHPARGGETAEARGAELRREPPLRRPAGEIRGLRPRRRVHDPRGGAAGAEARARKPIAPCDAFASRSTSARTPAPLAIRGAMPAAISPTFPPPKGDAWAWSRYPSADASAL